MADNQYRGDPGSGHIATIYTIGSSVWFCTAANDFPAGIGGLHRRLFDISRIYEDLVLSA